MHVNGAGGRKWMPETMGGGVAVLDFDDDGKLDLLFVSGTPWPSEERVRRPDSSLALYANAGNGPDGLPRFRNATRQAGLKESSTAWARPWPTTTTTGATTST